MAEMCDEVISIYHNVTIMMYNKHPIWARIISYM